MALWAMGASLTLSQTCKISAIVLSSQQKKLPDLGRKKIFLSD